MLQHNYTVTTVRRDEEAIKYRISAHIVLIIPKRYIIDTETNMPFPSQRNSRKYLYKYFVSCN